MLRIFGSIKGSFAKSRAIDGLGNPRGADVFLLNKNLKTILACNNAIYTRKKGQATLWRSPTNSRTFSTANDSMSAEAQRLMQIEAPT